MKLYNEKEIDAFVEKYLPLEIRQQLEQLKQIDEVLKLCELCKQTYNEEDIIFLKSCRDSQGI